jgi:hypothetical protein
MIRSPGSMMAKINLACSDTASGDQLPAIINDKPP